MSLKRGEIQPPQEQMMPRRQSRGHGIMDIADRFKFYGMDELQKSEVITIRSRVIELAKDIETLCPVSREKSLALTKLEEVTMWAVKSISHNPK